MTTTGTIPEDVNLREDGIVNQQRWQAIHEVAAHGATVSAIARQCDLDRKTGRRCLRQPAWTPYQRPAVATPLTPHLPWLETRAPAIGYSAQIHYQELRQHRGYTGSYETVKRWIAPGARPRSAISMLPVSWKT